MRAIATSKPLINALRLLAACVIALWAGLGARAVAGGLGIEAVRLSGGDARAEIVIEVSRAVSFDAAVTRAPYRLEISLPDGGVRLANPRTRGRAPLVAGVRIARKKDATRLIFKLRAPALIAEARAEPARGGSPARLVVNLRRTDARTLASMLGDDEPARRGEAPAGGLEKVKAAYRELIEQAAAPVSITDLIAAMPLPFDGGEDASDAPAPLPEASAATPAPAASASSADPVIVIDPGHGGHDPGAIGPGGVMEKRIVLKFALALRKALRGRGYRVVMTRDGDTFLRLRERVAVGRRHHAALFISIHADKFRTRGVGGLGIYTLSEKASDADAAELARMENAADLIGAPAREMGDDGVRDILVELTQRETNANSHLLALQLKRALKGVARLRRNPVRSAAFRVLRAPEIPSLLIELGYVTNRRDVRDMRSATWRRRLAARMARTIDNFLKIRLARR